MGHVLAAVPCRAVPCHAVACRAVPRTMRSGGLPLTVNCRASAARGRAAGPCWRELTSCAASRQGCTQATADSVADRPGGANAAQPLSSLAGTGLSQPAAHKQALGGHVGGGVDDRFVRWRSTHRYCTCSSRGEAVQLRGGEGEATPNRQNGKASAAAVGHGPGWKPVAKRQGSGTAPARAWHTSRHCRRPCPQRRCPSPTLL